VNGKDYYFVSQIDFDRIPMMETVHFSGYSYGGSVAEFERQFATGRIPVIVVEPNGANQIAKEAKVRDWIHLKLFVSSPLKELLYRNLERVYTNTAKADSSDIPRILHGYTNRFANLIQSELNWMTQQCWDVVIPAFNAETEEDVVEKINQMIDERLKQ
jgi:guanylate kinase